MISTEVSTEEFQDSKFLVKTHTSTTTAAFNEFPRSLQANWNRPRLLFHFSLFTVILKIDHERQTMARAEI
jgi:hypothetical protein